MSLTNQGVLTQKFLPKQELETTSTFFTVALLCNVSSMMIISGKNHNQFFVCGQKCFTQLIPEDFSSLNQFSWLAQNSFARKHATDDDFFSEMIIIELTLHSIVTVRNSLIVFHSCLGREVFFSLLNNHRNQWCFLFASYCITKRKTNQSSFINCVGRKKKRKGRRSKNPPIFFKLLQNYG